MNMKAPVQTRKKLGISNKPKSTPKSKGAEAPATVAEEPTVEALQGETLSARAVMEKVEEWFKTIGTEGLAETVMPVPPNRNNGPEAAEYAIADKLAKLAEKRKKEAFEAAQKAGVFGDVEDYIAGDTVTVWQSPYLNVSVKMGNTSKMIGKEETIAALETHLPKGKVAEVMEECMKTREASKQIIVSIK